MELNGVHEEMNVVCDAFNEVRGELHAQAGNMNFLKAHVQQLEKWVSDFHCNDDKGVPIGPGGT